MCPARQANTVVVNIDRLFFDDPFGEFEQRHIRPPTRTRNGEESEHSDGQIVDMGRAVPHGFIGKLWRDEQSR